MNGWIFGRFQTNLCGRHGTPSGSLTFEVPMLGRPSRGAAPNSIYVVLRAANTTGNSLLMAKGYLFLVDDMGKSYVVDGSAGTWPDTVRQAQQWLERSHSRDP